MNRRLSEILSGLGQRRFYLTLASVTVFAVHFAVSWFYSSPEIDPNVITVFIEPILELKQTNSIFGMPQVNYYTGNFFLILPLLEILGYSPQVFRGLMISLVAASTVLVFLGIEKKYGFRSALIGVLFLFNTGVWITFRFVDYTYVLFCASLLLYVFVLWEKSFKRSYLYLFAFLAGLFFYFKVIMAYLLVGLFLGTLLKHREDLIKYIDIRTAVIASILFLVGAAPFILMSFGTGFEWYEDVVTVEDNYAEERTLGEIAEIRFGQYNSLVRPHNYVRDSHAFFSPHIFLLVILAGLIISLYREEGSIYSVALLTMFPLTFYVTSVMTFRQVVILLPVSAYVFVSVLEVFDRSYLKTVLIILLLSGFLMYLTELPGHYSSNYPTGHNHAVTHQEFEEYRTLNPGNTVVTNHNMPYYWTKYDSGTEAYYLVDEEISTDSRADVAALRERRIPVGDFMDRYDETGLEFILLDTECLLTARICGTETEVIEQKFNLSNPVEKEIGGYSYRVYSD